MMRCSTCLLATAISLAGLAACGDDDSSDSGSGGAAAAGSTSTSTSSASTSSAGGGGGAPTPEDLVPPEPLGGDPATACPAAYADVVPAQGTNGGFESAGQEREFVLLEADPSFTGPRPLLVAFNGTGETGATFTARTNIEAFTARGFVVAAPSSNANGTIWPVWDAMHNQGEDDPDGNPDLIYFDELVACLGAHLEIDRNRIYVTGHSAGGIMVNYVLRRRSELLAGGIVASGVHSLTAPADEEALDEMFVLVTWGGDNDAFSGGGGISVPEINFVEQASIASTEYDAEPSVSQANCRGDDLGHVWLDSLNTWFADTLLEHPKGLALKGETTLAALPEGAPASCGVEVVEFTPTVLVECPTESTVAGCAETCQFIGDCVIENATVGPILGPQMESLGFAGEENAECGGCVDRCDEIAVTEADVEVLACMTEAQSAATCGPGIDGALPVIDALNVCCEGRSDSPWCVDTCTILLTSGAAAGFLQSCQAIVD